MIRHRGTAREPYIIHNFVSLLLFGGDPDITVAFTGEWQHRLQTGTLYIHGWAIGKGDCGW